MGMEQKTCYELDKSKCIKCGKCVNVCSGMVLEAGRDGYPVMKAFERFGWRGCWRCEHCLAYVLREQFLFSERSPKTLCHPHRLKWETTWHNWWSTAALAEGT